MKVRDRVERLQQLVGGLPPPGQLDLVVAVPTRLGRRLASPGRMVAIVVVAPAAITDRG